MAKFEGCMDTEQKSPKNVLPDPTKDLARSCRALVKITGKHNLDKN